MNAAAWGALLAAFAGLVNEVLSLLRARQARADGVTSQVAQAQKETIHEVQTATEARDAVAGDLVLHPDRVLEPDEFTRPD